jgi:hypothetical protein
VWPVQQYNLTVLLTGVRRTLGREVALRLRRRPERTTLPEELADLPVEVAGDSFGLAFGSRKPARARSARPDPQPCPCHAHVRYFFNILILHGKSGIKSIDGRRAGPRQQARLGGCGRQ